MPEMLISVTEASRNFAECVNRVRYQGASFLLQKNGAPVARLVPVEFEGDESERLAGWEEAGSIKPDTTQTRAAENGNSQSESLQRKPAEHDALNW